MLDLHTVSSEAPKNTRTKLAAVITLVIAGFVLLLLSLAFLIWRKARRSNKGQFFVLQGFIIKHLPDKEPFIFLSRGQSVYCEFLNSFSVFSASTMLDEAAELMSGECPTYPLGIIRTATNGFCRENIIGRGGFGEVYKVVTITVK